MDIMACSDGILRLANAEPKLWDTVYGPPLLVTPKMIKGVDTKDMATYVQYLPECLRNPVLEACIVGLEKHLDDDNAQHVMDKIRLVRSIISQGATYRVNKMASIMGYNSVKKAMTHTIMEVNFGQRQIEYKMQGGQPFGVPFPRRSL